MQLIVYFLRLCFLLYKLKDFLQLLLVVRLKSRRIVEDKSIDIVYPRRYGWSDRYSRYLWSTAEVGSS
jgi:hypothetical protein